MRDEPLPPNNSVFDISQEELEGIWDVPIKDDFSKFSSQNFLKEQRCQD